MEQSEEIVNGRRKINSYVISAVVLYLANQQNTNPNERQRPSRDTFKQIVQRLNDETRMCFLNAIVNELRYPSKHTFDFSCTILSIYAEAGKEIVFEQISQIFLERLQTCGPYPWGLMISFRELIQNPKLEFMKKQYIRDHPNSISKLFYGRLKKFIDFIPVNHR
jgi:CCR4-NOT transcription complex subunit 1